MLITAVWVRFLETMSLTAQSKPFMTVEVVPLLPSNILTAMSVAFLATP
jgi:hypothetical protein